MGKDKDNKKIPTQEEIAEYRRQVTPAANREASLALVMELDGVRSLPVLIAILEDMRQVFEKDLEAYLTLILTENVLQKCRTKDYKPEADFFVKYGENIEPKLKEFVLRKVETVTDQTVEHFAIDQVKLLAKAILGIKDPELLKKIKMDFFLVVAIASYKEMNRLQHLGTGAFVFDQGGKHVTNGFFNVFRPDEEKIKTRDIIQSPLYALMRSTKMIDITNENLVGFFQELEIWMDGIFQRGLSVLYPGECRVTNPDGTVDIVKKKDKEGNLHYVPMPNDDVDTELYKHGSLSKYRLSFVCYKAVREQLLLGVQRFNEAKQKAVVEKTAVVNPSVAPGSSALSVAPTPSQPIAIVATAPTLISTIPLQTAGSSQTDGTPSQPVTTPRSLISTSPSEQRLFQRKSSSAELIAVTDDEKIDKLCSRLHDKKLKTHPLSSEQLIKLEDKVKRLRAECDAYKQTSRYGWWAPNCDIADRIIKAIDGERDVDHYSNVVRFVIDQIPYLTKRERHAGDSDLLKTVKKTLLNLYQGLLVEVALPYQNTAPVL